MIAPCPALKRDRNVVACELTIAEGRITSLRRQMETLEPDSEASRIHSWYSRRLAALRRELESITGG